MKVCHLTSVHRYNDTRISIKECESLVSFGHEVHLVAPNTEVEKFKGINVRGVKNTHKGRLNRIRKFTKEIYLKSLEIDADVYHFHDPELLPIGRKLKKSGKKIIYDVHEDVPRAILSKDWIPKVIRKILAFIFEKYEDRNSKKFDYIIGATPTITNRFLKLNKNSVNINNYPLLNELKNKNPIAPKKRQVCYVGGLSSIRGINTILEVAEDLEKQIVLAGTTNSLEMEKEIRESKVDYQGALNRKEVSILLNNSLAGLVLFLPEPNHINAQPNKMFEYMSAGIFVIGSNFPLWKEIIEGNRCGVCVDPTNKKEIEKNIRWVLENPEEAIKFGQNGRKAIEDYYNWETESEKLKKIYNNLTTKELG